MKPFTLHTGLVAPMDRENVDTDAIIPKQFLKSIKRTGFGPNLFDDWRYLDPGEPGQDPASRRPEPRLRAEPAALPGRVGPAGAQELRLRLVARARAVGARPVRLPRASSRRATPTSSSTTASRTACCRSCCRESRWLAAVRRGRRLPRLPADDRPGAPGRRQARRQRSSPSTSQPFRKYCLVDGFDDIGLTLRHADKIRAFEAERLLKQPWLAATIR